ncbi:MULTISPECIES: biotin carboxylase N-terminal domain-containing protein [Streptomyces]|uniref:Biotin carboxylase N-terminal domain-containing protein n=1 Tax=Streptomyces luteosporeus TaxID=173856 RepID=A0ABP6FYI6_9ACTN
MIGCVLVANRGEIAVRVFRTCRELGIATVAVHSDPDAGALHVRQADAAVRLPGAAPADTYLRGDLLVRAARAAGADAVHPGYGFLSEDAGFARAVVEAGLVWIGPPPEAIEAMASKTRAKRLMAQAGVPLPAPVDLAAVTAADLPLLLKAAAGGGGRGMRIVRRLPDLPAELASARAEAAAAFGDDEVFAEPYLEGARHVEVQILADTHGTVWTLGTRDCSVQRRHQKVIEEAPAPGLDAAVEAALRRAAEAAARAIAYVGAGTVEFLLRPGPAERAEPVFLEMNTRLQVEHAVTEAVYGVDLVALQIHVAEGGALPDAVPGPRGHAVEARVYAEAPGRGFAPQTGRVRRLWVDPGAVPPGGPVCAHPSLPQLPLGGPPAERLPTNRRGGLRIDAGYAAGDLVTAHYDPLIAKVVAHAPTRPAAVRLLAHALERAEFHGPVTNRDLLVGVLRHGVFAAGPPDTGFLERELPALTRPDPDGARLAALAAALAEAAAAPGAWRNVPAHPQRKRYRCEPDGGEVEVAYWHARHGAPRPHDFPGVRVVSAAATRVVLETSDGVARAYPVAAYGDGRVHVGRFTFTALPRFADPTTAPAVPGSLRAPMPGTVVRLADGVTVGATVRAGQPLLWLEAMKMEHRVTAPATGVVTELHVAPGRQVETGHLLAVVQEDEP